MNNIGSVKHVFASSNTCNGFISLGDLFITQDNTRKIYLLKGVSDTAKSNLMKRIGQSLIDDGIDVEYHHCCLEPSIIKCLYIPCVEMLIINTTLPDPILPTVINLDEYLDHDKLISNKEAIIACNDIVTRCFQKSQFYLQGAGALYKTYVYTTEPSINEVAKLQYENFIIRNISQIVADNKTIGKTRTLFSYAITSEGIIDNVHTIIGKTKNIYLIKENLTCNSKQLMNRLKNLFIERGHTIECYMSPIDTTKIEDIIVPTLSLAFTASNPFRKPKIFPTDIYDFTNCINHEILETVELGAEKDFKLMQILLDKSYSALSNTKRHKETLDSYYTNAIDFSKVDEVYENIYNKIKMLCNAAIR
ncbi:MAG: hypothetical protein ATN34_02365 [Epulopiscium sp. Nele67-Bin002]|nr:MAG: hypothetical protein ATN33_02720 [Epulopiscium sp. Nele67-Bin001]OON92469.1 MAG: hypothetical protein ATN34_02365 [Epulopiscium sp. Nele67-Bin002]